ncbi:Divergent polysaccharide deacetylase [Pseudodesulfovibrio hydrargyri]|uniref:Divergent polysaccharide deacetylase n=1 Tax=Pseudodesulfovibrio hydrargyri TaxID=2125990 RepID=A0A1J5N0D5_9BACT|nr:divergent polysaccharide deacetylase family protein [Pseudodesulfovibrio hydrargyri]OIQ51564.1 Divergent polysaccharide deacetylase [Pseudodesulfovibrio hydrargyri]
MDDRAPDNQTEKKTGLDGFLKGIYRPGPLICLFTLAFLALAGLGWMVLNAKTPPPQVIAPVAEERKAEPDKTPDKVYEEATSDMEDLVKQADLALIETMRDLDLKMRDLDLVDVELRSFEERGYHYQVLLFPKVTDRNQFLVTLRKRLYERLPDAVLLDNGDTEAAIEINGVRTHRLLLEATPRIIARPEAKGPKLVVVIDDVGENYGVLKGLAGLDLPLTFAVWPHASHTRECVELISGTHHDLLVHFPMEPMGYPKVKPGDDALFVSMTGSQIRQRIKENLERIPEAIGVNNHMGSRFTSNGPGMAVALAEFKRHGLFFLDSLTSGKSVGRATAQNVGIPFYERDTFLDNVKDVNAILLQLRKTERVAQRQGRAIAIGHPYRQTLAALKQWQDSRDTSIQVIPLSKLPTE